MPILTLTDRLIAGLMATRRTTFVDAKHPDLALRVTPHRTKTWVTFYRAHGRRRMLTHGTYPDLKLADARELHHEARRRIKKDGIDPGLEKQRARDVLTVGDLWRVYLAVHAKRKKKSWQDDVWRYEKYLEPPWHHRPVQEITRSDVHTLLDKIVAAGKPVQANRVMRLISKMWNVAIDREHAAQNPCYRMPMPSEERPRRQVADDDGLRKLWAGLDAAPSPAADALRLRLLTAQRGDEVNRMRWEDLELETGWWTIPETKNTYEQRVWLTPRAIALLRARREQQPRDEPRVFPTVTHFHKDMRALAALHEGRYRWHDLRRVVNTRLAAHGFPQEWRSALLNHKARNITDSTYNAYRYDREKREMLEFWDRALQRVLNEEPPMASVIAMPPRGRSSGLSMV